MNKIAVRTAIERRIDFLFTKVITNPANAGKDLSKYKAEIFDLCSAYEEMIDVHSNVVQDHNVESIKMLISNM